MTSNAVERFRRPADAEVDFKSPLTAGMSSWRVLLAFFNLDEGESLPEQEQAFRLFANGVADQITFDYGDFAVISRLEELVELPGAGY